MPRKPSGNFDQTQYIIDYNRQNVIVKRLPFNRLQDEDMELLTWAESHGNFTGYVKGLIRQDLETAQGKPGPVRPGTDPES